jgi:hypothetical protein
MLGIERKKESTMKYSWIVRLIGVLLLVIGLVAVGAVAYNAGMAQGQTQVIAAPHGEVIGAGRFGLGFHPLAALIALPFLCFGGLFFLMLFAWIPLRLVFGTCGPARMHLHGRWGGGEGRIPGPVEEWHRRMHEQETKKTGD